MDADLMHASGFRFRLDQGKGPAFAIEALKRTEDRPARHALLVDDLLDPMSELCTSPARRMGASSVLSSQSGQPWTSAV